MPLQFSSSISLVFSQAFVSDIFGLSSLQDTIELAYESLVRNNNDSRNNIDLGALHAMFLPQRLYEHFQICHLLHSLGFREVYSMMTFSNKCLKIAMLVVFEIIDEIWGLL